MINQQNYKSIRLQWTKDIHPKYLMLSNEYNFSSSGLSYVAAPRLWTGPHPGVTLVQ